MKKIIALRKRLNDIYVHHTGQDIETVENSMDRDNFMSPQDAVKYGLIDEVVEHRALPADAADS